MYVTIHSVSGAFKEEIHTMLFMDWWYLATQREGNKLRSRDLLQ